MLLFSPSGKGKQNIFSFANRDLIWKIATLRTSNPRRLRSTGKSNSAPQNSALRQNPPLCCRQRNLPVQHTSPQPGQCGKSSGSAGLVWLVPEQRPPQLAHGCISHQRHYIRSPMEKQKMIIKRKKKKRRKK